VASSFTFSDICCGMGGFRVSLESFGGKCLFSCDSDKFVNKTYLENYGEECLSDITQMDLNSIPYTDVICAGFPCQPFSNSGLRKGFEDERGSVIFSIVELVKIKKPIVVFLENVRGILSHDKGNTFKSIENLFLNIGYTFDYKLIDSREWIPQSRNRVYMVAVRKDVVKDGFVFNFHLSLLPQI